MWIIEINVSIYDERGPHEGECLFDSNQTLTKVKTKREAKVKAEQHLRKLWKQEIGFNQTYEERCLAPDEGPDFDGRWEHEDETKGKDGESLMLEFGHGGGVDGFGDGPTTREYIAVIYKEKA